MVLSILEMVFPVLLMIFLGWLCCHRQIFTAEGLGGIKSLVSGVVLPVVLFNAFFTADYSAKIALTFAVTYAACALGLGLGFLLRRLAKPFGRFFPFLVTNFEGGMLGYALFGLLYAGQTKIFAMVDIGQTLASFTVFLIALQAVSSGRADPKALAKSALTNPCLIGTVAGALLGALGVGRWVLASPAGKLVTEALSFVTAPASGMILIVVGYELSFRRDLMKPVLITALLRVLVMGVLLALSSLVIFSVIPFEKPLFTALMLACSLPAPFIVPLYAGAGEDSAYISTALSVETLVTVLLFAGVAAYTLM